MLVCLIGSATIALTGVVARDLVRPGTGVIAAVIAALYPGFWVFDGEIMSEALVMLLAALIILAANRCFRAFTVGRLVVLALLTGLGALTRAELVLLVPLVALPTVLVAAVLGRRRRLGLCAWPWLVALAPMLPWFARNITVFHHPVYLSDQFPITVAAANNHETYYGPLIASWCFPCLLNVHFPPGDDESDQALYWQGVGPAVHRGPQDPGPRSGGGPGGAGMGVLRPVTRQVIRTSSRDGPTPVSDAWLFWYYPLLALAVGGAVILKRRRQPIYPLMAMFIVASVTAVTTYGNYRFRTEAEVALVVLAAVSLDAIWATVAGRPRPGRQAVPPPPAQWDQPVLRTPRGGLPVTDADPADASSRPDAAPDDRAGSSRSGRRRRPRPGWTPSSGRSTRWSSRSPSRCPWPRRWGSRWPAVR